MARTAFPTTMISENSHSKPFSYRVRMWDMPLGIIFQSKMQREYVREIFQLSRIFCRPLYEPRKPIEIINLFETAYLFGEFRWSVHKQKNGSQPVGKRESGRRTCTQQPVNVVSLIWVYCFNIRIKCFCCSYGETLIHMLKGNIGPGAFSMGDAFKNGGIILSPILTLFISLISVHNQHILVR